MLSLGLCFVMLSLFIMSLLS